MIVVGERRGRRSATRTERTCREDDRKYAVQHPPRSLAGMERAFLLVPRSFERCPERKDEHERDAAYDPRNVHTGIRPNDDEDTEHHVNPLFPHRCILMKWFL